MKPEFQFDAERPTVPSRAIDSEVALSSPDLDSELDPVARFKRVFARLAPGTPMPLEALYDPRIHFQDPLHGLHGIEALQRYFARLNSRIIYAEFTFTDELRSPGAALLTWTMRLQPRMLSHEVIIEGATHLRFADRVTYQRDYFDLGAMIYERLPLLGPLLRWIKRQA